MNTHNKAHVNQLGQQPIYGSGSGYPGIGFPNSNFTQGGNLPTPFSSSTPASSSSLGGMLSNLPLKDIKGFIDRMGGIDGMLNMVTKMQKVIGTVQQAAPMLKLLMGSLVPSKAKTTDAVHDDIKEFAKRRKRRRRKKSSGRTKKTGSSRARKRTR